MEENREEKLREMGKIDRFSMEANRGLAHIWHATEIPK